MQTILCINLIKCSSSSQTAVHNTRSLQKTKELLYDLSLSKCCLYLSTVPGCAYVVRWQFLTRTNRVSRLYYWHLFPLHSSFFFLKDIQKVEDYNALKSNSISGKENKLQFWSQLRISANSWIYFPLWLCSTRFDYRDLNVPFSCIFFPLAPTPCHIYACVCVCVCVYSIEVVMKQNRKMDC